MTVQVTNLLSKCLLHCLLMDINNIVVMMESNKVTLQLRNSTFNIGFDMPIEQKSVDGLVHLITVLKLCEGWESLAYESTTEHVHVNDISFLDSEKLSRKTFSKSCNSILNWSSTKYAV